MPLTVNDKEAKELHEILVAEGMCSTPDEAAHFLYDAGEIDSCQHFDLLSEAERMRVYGE